MVKRKTKEELAQEKSALEAQRAAEAQVERANKRRVILDALAARETEKLNRASREELLAKLAELDG